MSRVWHLAYPRGDVREVMNERAPVLGDQVTLVIAWVTWVTFTDMGQQGP